MSGTSSQSSPAPSFFLACFAGPDRGKRVALGDASLVFGRSVECNLLSDDPDVAERHATLWFTDGKLSVRPFDAAPTFVDGHRLGEAVLVVPGQQLRLGRSVWRVTSSGVVTPDEESRDGSRGRDHPQLLHDGGMPCAASYGSRACSARTSP